MRITHRPFSAGPLDVVGVGPEGDAGAPGSLVGGNPFRAVATTNRKRDDTDERVHDQTSGLQAFPSCRLNARSEEGDDGEKGKGGEIAAGPSI